MESESVCLFHDDKLIFQRLCRDIQHTKLIPRPYVYRLGMAICSCKRNKPEVRCLFQVSDLERIISTVKKDVFSATTEKHGSFLNAFLDSLAERGVSLSHYSACMLFYVIYQSCVNKHFEFLESQKPKQMEKKTEKNKPDKEKVREIVVQKRIRKLSMKEKAIIKIYPRNLKRLKDSSAYKRLLHGFKNDIVLTYDETANSANMARGSNVTNVIYHFNDREKMVAFRANLSSAALQIQEKMDNLWKEWQFKECLEQEYLEFLGHRWDDDDDDDGICYERFNVAQVRTNLQPRSVQVRQQCKADRAKARKINRMERFARADDTFYFDQTAAACAVKETLTDDFLRKAKKGKSHNSLSTPLKGGHCLNCLKDFNGLKNSDPCKHHPGYIKQSKWTCCGQQTEGTKSCFKDHAGTGCEVICEHRWRPKKHRERKSEGFVNSDVANSYKLCRDCLKVEQCNKHGRQVARCWNSLISPLPSYA